MADNDSDYEEGEEVVIDPEEGGFKDDLLSISSHQFSKDDYIFIEHDKSNTALYVKLAECGVKVDEVADTFQKALTEDDYFTMRNYLMEKYSWVSKYLPAAVPAVEESAKSKGGKKGSAKKPVVSKKDEILQKNTLKLLIGDVDNMRINNDVSIFEVNKWHKTSSLLLYMVYWGLFVVHALRGKLKLDKGNATVTQKVALDCCMSLYRARKGLAEISPPTLLSDVDIIDELLKKYLVSSFGADILGLLFVQHPELISSTFYDTIKPKSVNLYDEQRLVLEKLNDSLTSNVGCLIGYQVPPSGGKTILSVSIAAMMSHKFRSKRLLYVCYNTLVRKAVANACYQAGLPFWLASFRYVRNGIPYVVIQPSNLCLDLSKRAKRERFLRSQSGGFIKEKALGEALSRAEIDTIHHCPIIVADLACALLLLEAYPDDYVAYVDEPTAGAERGLECNRITSLIAGICARLPAQAVLLSATLPDLETELPSLVSDFKGRHKNSNVIKVTSLRLPVGCDAVDETGSQLLPHQLAENFAEFKSIVGNMHGDALMQRFYTPSSVRQMALCITEAIGRDNLPSELLFERVIPHVGAVKHDFIRKYAQSLLEFVATLEREEVFLALKSLQIGAQGPAVTPDVLLTQHCIDGRSLAIATPSPSGAPPEINSLYDIIKTACAPYSDKIPKVTSFVHNFNKRLEDWTHEGVSLSNAKVSKRDKEAADALQDSIISHELGRPQFEWPLKIHGRGAGLTVQEMTTLDEKVVEYLLSGIGIYDPTLKNNVESTVVIREAMEGRLSCLFASPIIVYGTNIDLVTVFIGSSYSRYATRNSLYQLIGRAGRTGKSHRARVLFQDHLTLRKAMIPSSENIEATIIEHHLKRSIASGDPALSYL